MDCSPNTTQDQTLPALAMTSDLMVSIDLGETRMFGDLGVPALLLDTGIHDPTAVLAVYVVGQ